MTQELFYRSFSLNRELVDDEKRSTSVIFSTEEPVSRWFGSEILLHGKKNVDLKRLKSIGAALMNHDPDRIIGPILNAKIEDSQGKAELGFDDDDDGNRAMGKVKSGSLRGVSVGYRILKFREILNDEEWTDEDSGRSFKGPAMIATKWEPIEISLTPIPADSNSKIGRELSRSLDGIEIERKFNQERIEEMDENKVKEIINEALRGLNIPKQEDIVNAVKAAIAEDAKPKRSVDLEVEQTLCSQAAAVSQECELNISRMIRDGKNETECLREINKTLLARADSDENPGGGGSAGDQKNIWETIDDDQLSDNLRNLDDFTIN